MYGRRSARGGGGSRGGAAASLDATPLSVARVSGQFAHGPVNPEGVLVDLSDRPMMCMSTDVARGMAVIGSSDHALYEVRLSDGAATRTLYTKRYGHSEWVTCVAHLADGRVVSGAMDSKLCLWNGGGSTSTARCDELLGHFGSVSCVTTYGDAIVSGGYDKTVRLWSSTTKTELQSMTAHKAPVLCMAPSPSFDESGRPAGFHVVSGDRDGMGYVFDMVSGKTIGRLKGHSGHLTSVAWVEAGGTWLTVTGAQDGHVRLWDVRAKAQVANVEVHVTDQGAGAVSDMAATASTATGGVSYLVTSGADKCINVLDPRAGWAPLHTMTEHKDFIYTLKVAGGLCFTGAGDGLLIAHDVQSGEPLWGLGANAAAVRGIGVTPDRLIATGDDGNALVYQF